jgi:hypothetical protein
MLLTCVCHVFAMSWPCCMYVPCCLPYVCHVFASLLCYAFAMSSPCVIVLYLPCCCHVFAMSLPFCCPVFAMLSQCIYYAFAMHFPCFCHVFAMSCLPCMCHAFALYLPCLCHVFAIRLPCLCVPCVYMCLLLLSSKVGKAMLMAITMVDWTAPGARSRPEDRWPLHAPSPPRFISAPAAPRGRC